VQQSFVTDLLDTQSQHGLSKAEVAWLAGFMMYDDSLDIKLYDRLTV
jgi:hypothetical protein